MQSLGDVKNKLASLEKVFSALHPFLSALMVLIFALKVNSFRLYKPIPKFTEFLARIRHYDSVSTIIVPNPSYNLKHTSKFLQPDN